jgi:hypothetical protein
MATGALRDSTANAAIATTGILGPKDVDGIPAGTICFAWAFQMADGCHVFSHQQRFSGGRCEVQKRATEYALQCLAHFHARAQGEKGELSDDRDPQELRSRSYPIREDMAYQLKVWRFERVGWYVLVLVVVLGLVGVFSRGLISSRDVSSDDGKIRVEYEMFHRNGSTNPMKISVHATPDSTVELALAGQLLEGFSIETLQPEPLRSRSSSQGIKLWLQTDLDGQATLYLTLRGDGLGFFRSQIASPGTHGVKLEQFIFP